VVVRNCSIWGNALGIYVEDSDSCVLESNVISSNFNTLYRNGASQVGVDFAANAAVVRDNVICDAVAGVVGAHASADLSAPAPTRTCVRPGSSARGLRFPPPWGSPRSSGTSPPSPSRRSRCSSRAR
jgi:parallel beta-helix repeat protein